MLAHTRAWIAASAHAFAIGKKVAGVYDHSAAQHLKIAAEARGEHLQGLDGDRSSKFGGTLPDLYDVSDKIFVALQMDGASASGFDHGSSSAFTANVSDRLVQIYDHQLNQWFAYTVQTLDD